MPGAYAHITLVNELREPVRLEGISGFPFEIIPSILKNFKYCEMGGVSPDYPYLAIMDGDAAKWADVMHYEHTVDMIHSGIKHLRKINDKNIRGKCIAWLLGYAAHVTGDVTIHPIVQLKVGPYEENQKAHRVCEMNQDAYIFQRLNLGEIGLSEHLDSGISKCGGAAGNLDSDIKSLWLAMLKDVYPSMFEDNPPNLDAWHSGFKNIVDNFAEEGNKLIPLARHVAAKAGLTYPAEENIDQQFIANLKTPTGVEHYDVIFDAAVKNIGVVWSEIANAIVNDSHTMQLLVGNWNLDTGENEAGKIVFWS